MIRRRIPIKDDHRIYSLIVRELLPLARRALPDTRVKKKIIRKRLVRGITYVAARSEDLPAGFITLYIEDELLHIDMLAVHRTSHRKGIGSALLHNAEQYGRARNCLQSLVYVDQYNELGLQFYAQKGYSIVEYVPDIHCYLLEKALD